MAPKRTKAAQKGGRKKKRLENPVTSHTDISQPQNSDSGQSLTLPSSLTPEAIVESVIAVLERKGVIPPTQQTAIPMNSGTVTSDQLTTNSDHASSSDSDTLRQVQQALCPTMPDTSAGMEKATLFTSALSPGALIPDKLKQQIWNNEYIDLASLVDKRNNSDDITLKLSKTTRSISVTSKDENKNLSMSKWLSAFTVYMDIYLQKHPRDASGLLAYLNLVRDLERVHGVAAFNYYDKNFRAHRQVQPLAWGSLHHELWIRATTMSLAVQQRPSTSASGKYCFKYNKQQGCHVRNCMYEHICAICRKPHPQFRCLRKINTSSPAHNSNNPGALPSYKHIDDKPSGRSFRASHNNSSKK